MVRSASARGRPMAGDGDEFVVDGGLVEKAGGDKLAECEGCAVEAVIALAFGGAGIC
jgi:hypothetical protein